MSSKTLQERIETDELKLDSKRLSQLNNNKGKRFMQEIEETFEKNYDKLHVSFIEKNGIVDIKDLELVRKVFNYIKSN